MKTQTVTKVYYTWVNEKGETKPAITSEVAFNRQVQEAKDAKEPEPKLIASQTVQLSLAETMDEALALSGGNQEIAVAHFNYGSSLRQHNEANDLIQSDSFAPQEGVLDLAYAVATKPERRAASPEEKAAKTLGITPEQLRAALELVRGQSQVAAS